ncbi:MAG: 50S ribosomal protein L4 [Patescibacteria group bacterium]
MSLSANIYNQKAEVVGQIDLTDKVFGLKAQADLLHQAIVAQMSNERQVLAHTKDRSEVRGGGKKPWKQKGTGRARVGSSRSPIWIGGGVTFGPTKDRNFSKKINKKMRQKALYMALSDKLANQSLVIVDKLEMPEFKTKTFNQFLKAIESQVLKSDRRSVLLINGSKDEKVKFSGRNLADVKIINPENLNILDVLQYKNLLIGLEAVKVLNEQPKK